MEGSLHHLPARPAASGSPTELQGFVELCAAIENGAGLPAILRAAARARETADGRSAWWREGVEDALRETPTRDER